MKSLLKPKTLKILENRRSEFIDNFWMNLGDTTKIETKNPFKTDNELEKANPLLHIVNVMRRPENFRFTCEHIFNKKIQPFQQIILETMWNKPFPLLIGSRGMSKTFLLAIYAMLRALFTPGSKVILTGAGFRQAKLIFEYCESIWKESPLFQDILSDDKLNRPSRDIDRCTFRIGTSTITAIPTGCLEAGSLITTEYGFRTIESLINELPSVYGNKKFREMGFFYDSGISENIRVKTLKGYEFCGTPNHKMKIIRDGQIKFIRTDEMIIGDKILIDRNWRWHNNNILANENDCYVVGLMIGDGNYTNKYFLRFTTKTGELVPYLNKSIGEFKPESDGLHYNFCGKKKVDEWLKYWGLKNVRHDQKCIPPTMMMASREKMAACLRGLFDTDGTVRSIYSKGGWQSNIGFTTTSPILAKQIQYILLHFGIISTLTNRLRHNKKIKDNYYKRQYDICITGKDFEIFTKHIGFGLNKKKQLMLSALANKKRIHSIKDILPQELYNYIKIHHPEIVKDRKVLTRQRWNLFKKDIYLPKNLLELIDDGIFYDEIKSINKEDNKNMYDINIPEGNEYCANGFYSHNTGEKIRGLRASDLICDEFNSIDPNIFEHIMQGFSSVNATPADNVEFLGRVAALKQLGRISNEEAEEQNLSIGSNRTIISGTCGYEFEHFCKYWKRYKAIVESRGNRDKLEDIFNGEIPAGFNWKDYAIIRIPYNLIPKGFMDEKAIGKAKATIHTGMFGIEYESIFLKDSQGFFRRSLIEQCICGKGANPISFPSCGTVSFCASLVGDYKKQYVIAIDPASEIDNFTIVVLEIWQDHRRIVHCWSTTKERFKSKLKKGLTAEHDFYRYCVKKIRELKKLFPCELILMDSQGGGYQIQEILGDPTTLKDYEQPIYPVIVEGEEKTTDDMPGEHILELINFADAQWTNEANHGLRKDLETRTIVFPHIDSVALGMAAEEDRISGRVKIDPNDSSYEELFDTLESCVWEIEELKEELTLIVHTKTPNGRDHWDTPEIKTNTGKKGRLRKDRYSALLMANMGARIMAKRLPQAEYKHFGGIAQHIGRGEKKQNKNEVLYQGPDWFTQKLKNSGYGTLVRRGGV